MNSLICVTFCLLSTAIACLAGPISLHVQVHNQEAKDDGKGAQKSRDEWLAVRITNLSHEAYEGLTLHWVLYTAKLKKGANQIAIKQQGDSKSFSLPPEGRHTDITTPHVTFTWTPQHSEKQKSKGGGKNKVTTKLVPESGERYYGYAVKVLRGKEVVAEMYSQESLKPKP